MCANTSAAGVAHAGEEGRINVLPWYRLVGVVGTSRETQGGKTRLPARVSGRHGDDSPHLSWNAPRQQARLVNTVKIQVRWAAAHIGQDRRLPSVVTHSRLQRATSVRSRVGIFLEDGSGVAIDWVTGPPFSSARRRLNVQSGQRKGRKVCCGPLPERCRP